MKIYSWNMLFRNAKPADALAFVRESGFDVFCLQEVPETFLEELKKLPSSIAYELEAERLLETRIKTYLVTLTKHPIQKQERFSYPNYAETFLPRTEQFLKLMRPLRFCLIENRGGFYTDIVMHDRVTRVFNLHLMLSTPRIRQAELAEALTYRDVRMPTILCGDFNILESWHITLMNWLMGGTWSDVISFSRERQALERQFTLLDLVNPLRGYITHPVSNSQLDHIVLSHELPVQSAQVITHQFGSDHYPICVTISG